MTGVQTCALPISVVDGVSSVDSALLLLTTSAAERQVSEREGESDDADFEWLTDVLEDELELALSAAFEEETDWRNLR